MAIGHLRPAHRMADGGGRPSGAKFRRRGFDAPDRARNGSGRSVAPRRKKRVVAAVAAENFR
jgi:hypothetical protein